MANCGEQTPCNCENDPCGCKTSSDEVVYTGPTLPCTLIENCTTVTEVITVFNNYLCSPEFMSGIIQTIINTPALLEQITTIVNSSITCDTIWDCQTTTTTTTAEPTTTTTTTTEVCDCFLFNVSVSSADILAADGGVVYASYANCINDGVIKEYTAAAVYNDDFCSNISVTTPQLYYYVSAVLTPAENQPVQALPCCNEATTTTTTTII